MAVYWDFGEQPVMSCTYGIKHSTPARVTRHIRASVANRRAVVRVFRFETARSCAL